jgi:30S ribosomal protein S31
MGKGDQRTTKGKRFSGSYGKTRPRSKSRITKHTPTPAEPAKEETKKPEAKAEKTTKKAKTKTKKKSTTAKKTTTKSKKKEETSE